jgi:predicted aspartyl protease
MRVILLFCASQLLGQNLPLPSQPIRLPFQLLAPELPLAIVQSRANQQLNLRTVIDTGNGAVPLLLSRKAAEKMGLVLSTKSLGTAAGVGSGPGTQMQSARLALFSLGDYQVQNLEIGVSSTLDDLSTRSGQSIDANIGYHFLKYFTLSIDHPNRQVTLSTQRLANGVPFTLSPKKPLLILPVKINNQGPFTFALDTGASSSVISPILAQRLGLPRGMDVPMLGASGATTAYLTTVDSLSFAGAVNRNLTLATGDFFDALSQSTGTRIDGILGFNSFQNLTLTIDYPNSRLSTQRQ